MPDHFYSLDQSQQLEDSQGFDHADDLPMRGILHARYVAILSNSGIYQFLPRI
jgi:hypothetical protein